MSNGIQKYRWEGWPLIEKKTKTKTPSTLTRKKGDYREREENWSNHWGNW